MRRRTSDPQPQNRRRGYVQKPAEREQERIEWRQFRRESWDKWDAERRVSWVESLSPHEQLALEYQWEFWARDDQLEPADFQAGRKSVWALNGGRGCGKNRTGSEHIRKAVETGRAKRILIAGRTPGDARDGIIGSDFDIMTGVSSMMAVFPPWSRPTYFPSKRRLEWPTGAIGMVRSGANPNEFRSIQADLAWFDEFTAYADPRQTYDTALLGVRLGEAKILITTTPRPLPVYREILSSPDTHVTRMTTYDNLENLSDGYKKLIKRLEGTRFGKQELLALLLDDTPGALWNRDLLERQRRRLPECNLILSPQEWIAYRRRALIEQMSRIIIAIDPATTSGEDSDETGIIVCGLGLDGDAHILADLSGHYQPEEWAKIVCQAFKDWDCDQIVAENNNGGELVKRNIQAENRAIGDKVEMVHASRGKQARAEPVSTLYEQKPHGKIWHHGLFPELEDQMCRWIPNPDERPKKGESPDRVDALVWGITFLLLIDEDPALNRFRNLRKSLKQRKAA